MTEYVVMNLVVITIGLVGIPLLKVLFKGDLKLSTMVALNCGLIILPLTLLLFAPAIKSLEKQISGILLIITVLITAFSIYHLHTSKN